MGIDKGKLTAMFTQEATNIFKRSGAKFPAFITPETEGSK
jgi:hypothetical protein